MQGKEYLDLHVDVCTRTVELSSVPINWAIGLGLNPKFLSIPISVGTIRLLHILSLLPYQKCLGLVASTDLLFFVAHSPSGIVPCLIGAVAAP